MGTLLFRLGRYRLRWPGLRGGRGSGVRGFARVAEGGVGPSLIDDEWIYKPTDKTLFKTIAEGRKGTVMVGWSKELDPDQTWKVIAYIRSLYQGDPDKIIW